MSYLYLIEQEQSLPPSDKDKAQPEEPAPPEDDILSEAFFRDQNVAEMEGGTADRRRKILGRLFLYALPLLSVLFLLDLALRVLLPPKSMLPYTPFGQALYTIKLEHYKKLPPPDVLILGSSRIRHGVNPKVLKKELEKRWGREVRVYNLGLDNMQGEELYALVTGHLEAPGPPYIIVGISGATMAWVHNFRFASRFLWGLPHLVSYLQRTSYKNFQAKNVENFLESFLCSAWYLYQHRDALKKMVQTRAERMAGMISDRQWAAMEQSREKFTGIMLADDGYEAFQGHDRNLAEQIKNDPDGIYIPSQGLLKNRRMFNDDSVELLKLTLERLKTFQSRVILVEAPASPYLQEKGPVPHGQFFRKWMERVAERLGVDFVTFPPNEKILTNDLYGDTNHLTPKGAKIYTRLLYHKLSKMGYFEEEPP
jgi:hypothetical protein